MCDHSFINLLSAMARGFGGGFADGDGMPGLPMAVPERAFDTNMVSGEGGGPDQPELPKISVRKYFPETWLWDIILTEYVCLPSLPVQCFHKPFALILLLLYNIAIIVCLFLPTHI